MKTLYVVRHCKAEGQEADARLTPEGVAQASSLADSLATANIERIISSPYMRATQSIAPLARRLGLAVEIDTRLVERALCSGSRPDWQDCLRASFLDLDLSFEGGESSREAMRRAVAVVTDIQRHPAQRTLLVTHGNLMAILLKYFDDSIGFAEWCALSNPDVYRVVLTQPFTVQRLWPS
ncbi:MAG: histidine phosphatase family protein [Acidobacteria bacterium]|nr:MAG: histidine phosphatase family protein [Acidobacteriota bacterium]